MKALAIALGLTLFTPVFAAAQQPAPDLAGRWSGYWQSDKNGHSGPLNARFRPRQDGSYRVLFTGRFFVVIPFIYSTTFHSSPISSDAVGVSASQNLGFGLGTFDTNGVATPTTFDARFTARGDSGRFVMSRKR